MEYKNKYLKYKNKYFKLKHLIGSAVCEKCPKLGFIQHSGECWHDSFSMIVLFTDDLSTDIQYYFNQWLSNPGMIDSYLESIFTNYEEQKYLLPSNINFITEEIKRNIILYVKQLFERYKKEFLYHDERDEVKIGELRQLSLDTSLQCVKTSYDFYNINALDKLKHEFSSKEHGGLTEFSFINLSILNFMLAKETIIRMVDIDLEYVKLQYISLDIVKKLINNCKGIEIHFSIDVADKGTIQTLYHSIACFICNNIEYIYDNERGTIATQTSIKEYKWKSDLLKYFESVERLIKIDEFINNFDDEYTKYKKRLNKLIFYYPDKKDSINYYYSPQLHCSYKNKESNDFWDEQLRNIIIGKNILYEHIFNDEKIHYIYKCIDDRNKLKLATFMFNKNINFDVNKYNILYLAVNYNDTELTTKLFKYPKTNINQLNELNIHPFNFCIINKNKDIINLFLEDERFNINSTFSFGSFLHITIEYIDLNDVSIKLIEKNINITIKDVEGKLAIFIAIVKNNRELFDILYNKYKQMNKENIKELIDKTILDEYIQEEQEDNEIINLDFYLEKIKELLL
jgi:hypothetical protein